MVIVAIRGLYLAAGGGCLAEYKRIVEERMRLVVDLRLRHFMRWSLSGSGEEVGVEP